MKKTAKIDLTFFGIYQVKNAGLSRSLPKMFTILDVFFSREVYLRPELSRDSVVSMSKHKELFIDFGLKNL